MSKFKVILRVCKDFGENTSILGKQKQISTNCTMVSYQTNKQKSFITGLGNAAKAKTKTRAATWLVIFSVCSAFTVEGIYTTINDILSYPYVTKTDITFQPKV